MKNTSAILLLCASTVLVAADSAPLYTDTKADGIVIRNEKGRQRATIEWEAPPALDLPEIPAGRKPRNIIFVIGDGMGFGARALASYRCHGEIGRLVMDRLPHAAIVTTFSRNSSVTDSTAAGTALATGFKTNNRMMSVIPLDKSGTNFLKAVSIATRAHGVGKSVGLLTSDYMAAATIGVFYANQRDRGLTGAILGDMPRSDFEVFYANDKTLAAFAPTNAGSLRALLEDKGYAFTKTQADFLEAVRKPGAKVVAHVPDADFRLKGENPRILGDALRATLENFAANDKGFFVMAESAHPDHGGHGEEGDRAMEFNTLGTIQCDWLAYEALRYAAEQKDTLVIVTADHETGGISAIRGLADAEPAIHHDTTSHTGAPVPLTAYGPGSELFTGVLDNTDLPRLMALLFGVELDPRLK